MPLLLDALPEAWIVARAPTGTLEALLPGGVRLVTRELEPAPAAGAELAWLVARAAPLGAGPATLVPFASAHGWPVAAAHVGGAAVIAYRFWSYAGVAVVAAPLDRLPAAALAALASGRPRFADRTSHLAELWA